MLVAGVELPHEHVLVLVALLRDNCHLTPDNTLQRALEEDAAVWQPHARSVRSGAAPLS